MYLISIPLAWGLGTWAFWNEPTAAKMVAALILANYTLSALHCRAQEGKK